MAKEAGLGKALVFGAPNPGEPELLSALLGTRAFKDLIWDWQFGRDPGRITPVTASLDGELVGFNGLMAIEARVAGGSVPAAWSCDFIVRPEYRRHGVGRALKQELDRRCPFLMTLGTSEAAAKVLAASGWQQGEGPRTYISIHRPRGQREWIRRCLQRPLHWLLSRGVPATGFELMVTDALPDDHVLDPLWAAVAPGYVRCVVRDAAYLRWRYRDHPLASYHYLLLRKDGRLHALAVVRRTPERASLVDYVGPATDRAAKQALAAGFVDFAASSRIAECTTSDRELRRALYAAGFLPAASTPLRFFVRVTADNPPVDPAGGWFLMGGDSDGEILAAARDATWGVREWSEAEFAAGRDAWEALLEASDADRLFMGWDWQYCWWQHFSRRHGLELRLVAVYDVHGALAGLAPCFVHDARGPGGVRLRRLEPIGNLWGGAPTMRSEYLGLVLRRGVEHEVAERLWGHLLGTGDWDDLAVQDWDAGRPGTMELGSIIGGRCRTVDLAQRELDEARYVPLAAGFAAYLAGLSGNARRSLVHRRRYLESLGEVSIEHATPSQVAEYFSELNRLHALRWGQPVFTGHRLAFHEDLATRLAAGDRLRFSRLSVNGQVRSVLYHLRGGTREHNLQMGFDDSFHADKMSLGLLHLGYAIEQAAGEGMERVDLLAGGGKQRLFKQRIAPGRTVFARRHYLRTLKARIVFGTRHGLRQLAQRVRKDAS